MQGLLRVDIDDNKGDTTSVNNGVEIANRKLGDVEGGVAVFIDEWKRRFVGKCENLRRCGVEFHGDVEIADGGNLEGIL